jgi:hypothetical protein
MNFQHRFRLYKTLTYYAMHGIKKKVYNFQHVNFNAMDKRNLILKLDCFFFF